MNERDSNSEMEIESDRDSNSEMEIESVQKVIEILKELEDILKEKVDNCVYVGKVKGI